MSGLTWPEMGFWVVWLQQEPWAKCRFFESVLIFIVDYPNFYDSLSLSWECCVATSPGPLLLSWKIPKLESLSCQLLAADPTSGDFTFWATVASFVERRRLLKRWLWPQWFPIWHMMGLVWRCQYYCLALQEAWLPIVREPSTGICHPGFKALLCPPLLVGHLHLPLR